MATVSFSKTPAAEVTTPPPPSTEVAVLQHEHHQLANPSAKQFSGSWSTRDDVRLPRCNLVHKTSSADIIEKFGIGSFVLNKEVKLGDGKTPIPVTAVHAYKDFVQKLPYGDGEMPIVYKSPEEVVENGGSLNRKDSPSGNYYQPRGHIQLVIQGPDGLSDTEAALFPYEFKGKPYVVAMLTVSSSAYSSVGREIATLANNNKVMQKGLHFGALGLTSDIIKTAAYTWHIPVIKFIGENEPELAAFFASLQP